MLKILVLDDEAVVCSVYQRDLERDGYAVVTGQPIDPGLEDVDDVSPDLVILRIHEQDQQHDLETMRRLMGRCPRIPILLTVDEPPEWNSVISESADGYVTRSQDTRPLREKIRQLLVPGL